METDVLIDALRDIKSRISQIAYTNINEQTFNELNEIESDMDDLIVNITGGE